MLIDSNQPGKQFFSRVGTEPPLPGYYQYILGSKSALVNDTTQFDPRGARTSGSGVSGINHQVTAFSPRSASVPFLMMRMALAIDVRWLISTSMQGRERDKLWGRGGGSLILCCQMNMVVSVKLCFDFVSSQPSRFHYLLSMYSCTCMNNACYVLHT